jgi:hypothetical protein
VLGVLDLDAGVRGLSVPAIVVGGTADRLTPMVHSHRLAAALPRCVELVELAGMGHMTPVEAPEAVTGKLRELTGTYLNAKEEAVLAGRAWRGRSRSSRARRAASANCWPASCRRAVRKWRSSASSRTS